MTKKWPAGFFFFLFVFLSSGVPAADRVVVVPLGGAKTDPNLLPENICFGINILGVTGTSANCVPTVISADGRIWMDRNLGASRVATSSTDTLAYGDLYQWGRLADGHQIRTSSTTPTLSTTDVPGHGNFIMSTTSPNDWRNPQNDTLWQGVSGTNNPCPSGFRIPTEAEWETERLSWSSNDANGAFSSPLKLVVAGGRLSSGTLFFTDRNGGYWSSNVGGTYGRVFEFSNSNAGMYNTFRANGYSIRCIMD